MLDGSTGRSDTGDKITYYTDNTHTPETTLCPKKHVTTFSTITLTIDVRLQ